MEKAVSVDGEVDPLARLALAESFARLTGELTKNNSLLIELSKLRMKKELVVSGKSDRFDEDESDAVFDEIERPDREDDGSN